jgi:serine/threonine-protein kinase SRPK3
LQVGETYNKRYLVEDKLGWGHFSTVWRCSDLEDGGRALALKVQKSAAHYTEAAADEIAILDFVSEQADAVGQDVPVVRLLDTFVHRGPNGKREPRPSQQMLPLV